MKTDLFAHEVTQTSSVFGRKSEINVVFEGDGARTDHQTVYLPALPMGVEVDEKSQKIIRGYSDHEAGHIRHTDRQVLLDHLPLFEANPKLHRIWNGLEDVWLERRVIAEYPGSRENIRETAVSVDEAALRGFAETDPKWKEDVFVGPAAITWEGRRDYGHDTGLKCLERVTQELRDHVKVWVKALDKCESTSDVLELAKHVHGVMQNPLPKVPVEPPPPKGGGGEDGEGEGVDEGEGEDEGDGGKPGVPGEKEGESKTKAKGGGEEDDKEVVSGDRQTEEGGHEAGDRGKTEDDYGYMEFDLKSAVEREIGGIVASGKGSKAYRPYSTAQDKVHTRHDADDKYAPSSSFGKSMRRLARDYPSRYADRMARVSGNINVVRRKLERSLMAQMNRAWTGGHVHGRLDPKRLVAAYKGSDTVYKLRDPAPELDTAVEILVDLSGSMCGEKAALAADVCVVLGEVLSKSGVPFEITGFNNRSDTVVVNPKTGAKETVYAHDIQEEHPGFHRYEPLDVYVFKAFDERYAEAKVHVAHLDQHADGNNSDSDALLMVVPRLEARHEKRKVFMVLSDGHPAFVGDAHKGMRHLEQVVKDMSGRGIECIGIGILDGSVSRFYPRHVVVNNLEDLGKHAVDQLAKVLLGERYVVDNATLMKGVA